MGNGPNSQNPTGPGRFGAPPTKVPAGPTDIAGGFDPDSYKAPEVRGLQTSILRFAPGMVPEGAVGKPTDERLTTFGTPFQDEMYTSDDAWSLPLSVPDKIPDIQRQLVIAGLLDPKKVRLGLWDQQSASAFTKVLGFANAYGMRAMDALGYYVNNPQPDTSTGRAQRTIAFTNPADVEAGFADVSQQMTGQEMPTAAFAGAYHGLEAAQNRDPGSDYTSAPSVQGAARDYLLENNPDDVRAYGVASRMNEFFNMLGGASG